jgi:hypothetical protein
VEVGAVGHHHLAQAAPEPIADAEAPREGG